MQKKTPVISRSFNHQSKNEQLIRLLLLLYVNFRARKSYRHVNSESKHKQFLEFALENFKF